MSNTIVIELCSEDRARIDKLITALERKTCDSCVHSALQWQEQVLRAKDAPEKKAKEDTDEVQQKLAETLAKVSEGTEPPKNATGEAETSTLTSTPPEEEATTDKEPTPPPTEKTVDRADVRAKVIELSAKGLKEQVRVVILAYAPTVKDVPEDKLNECYGKLVALEG